MKAARPNPAPIAGGWRGSYTTQHSSQDRWFSGNTYALMNTGGKRALKVSADRSSLPELTEGQYIDVRAGEYKRCQHYCDVSQFCEQWAKTKRTGGVNDDDA